MATLLHGEIVDKVKYLGDNARVPVAEAEPVDIVRSFNRFYTRWVGALDADFLRTSHSLPEARVLFELGRRQETEVAELRRALDMDAGYLSRLLGRLESEALVERERSQSDARRQLARLTKAGRREYQLLDGRSAASVSETLASLRPAERDRLTAAMSAVQSTLDPAAAVPAIALRAPGHGDYGWIIERHGAVYAEEFGWDARFEALVARIVADFAGDHDPRREAAWIAEVDGERAGSVLCVRKDDRTAQLRLLLVEPRMRGLGLGRMLVERCLEFAREAGYGEMTLWTNGPLRAARRVYDATGFAVVEEWDHRSFGHAMTGQNMSRPL